jgi:hypothetical protein
MSTLQDSGVEIADSAPEAIMAIETRDASVGADHEKNREAILVNLATYQE